MHIKTSESSQNTVAQKLLINQIWDPVYIQQLQIIDWSKIVKIMVLTFLVQFVILNS